MPNNISSIAGGFQEALAIVPSAAELSDSLTDLAGWDQLGIYESEPAMLQAWDLPRDARGREVLLGYQGSGSGYLRLVELDGVSQRPIRSHPQTWDTGGILDFNVRIDNMASRAHAFQEAGWYAVSDPVEWRFGDKLVSEWLTYGPGGLALALIERLDPPLPTGSIPSGLGHIFNSSQVVRDMSVALAFYEGALSFTKLLHIRQPLLSRPGANPLGIPHNLVAELDVEIAILSPSGEMEGSVELIRMHGLEGRDFSTMAHPPNIGMCALRFPVVDLNAVITGLEAGGVSAIYAPIETELPPYGGCRVMAVTAPDGAWLEFYQRL